MLVVMHTRTGTVTITTELYLMCAFTIGDRVRGNSDGLDTPLLLCWSRC